MLSRTLSSAQRRVVTIPTRRSWTSVSHLSGSTPGLKINALGVTFSYLWLRDSCPSLIHPSTRQKLHRSTDIRLDISPVEPDGVKVTDNGLQIHWNDGHSSSYDRSFLERYATSSSLASFHRDIKKEPWSSADLTSSACPDLFLRYSDLQDPGILSSAIDQLLRIGLLFVKDVPMEETSHETCEIRKLTQLFGEIKSTFYGDLWDVQNIVNSTNIAYTNLFLNMHMDLLYFEYPPKYQILHCLRNQVKGGKSLFVDALYAAHRVREEDKEAFDILTHTPVPFHYINDGHHLHYNHPTIELLPGNLDVNGNHEIGHLNYSPPFQAPLLVDTQIHFYKALAKFVRHLDDSRNVYEYLLKEGDAVIFDNRRVLHARTAFEDVEGTTRPGEPNRWLKGCYFEPDKMMDTGRILRKKIH